MRQTARRIIALIAIATGTVTTASAQQVVGEYIVGSRVISDVAINQQTLADGHVHTSPSDTYAPVESYPAQSYPIEQTYPEYPVESYPSEGIVSEGEYVEGGCADGSCEEGSGGKSKRAKSQAGMRMHYLFHGGEEGQTIPKQYASPDLFYNHYSNGRNQVNAEMYLSPTPVPPFVGNTWVTYQPFMPHNYLYKHTDKYHNHYDYGRGTNRTRAKYSVAPKQYAETFYNFIRIPR